MNAVKMPKFAAERKFIADRLVDLYVGLADEIVGCLPSPGTVSRSQTMTLGCMRVSFHNTQNLNI